MGSNWGSYPQPGYVSWLVIEPVNFWFIGNAPTHWATLARAELDTVICLQEHPGKYIVVYCLIDKEPDIHGTSSALSYLVYWFTDLSHIWLKLMSSIGLWIDIIWLVLWKFFINCACCLIQFSQLLIMFTTGLPGFTLNRQQSVVCRAAGGRF